MCKIAGAKGTIQDIDKFIQNILSFSKKENVLIQVFNADMIYGKKHLISAVKHAKRAIANKKNTSNTLEKEILLYASGERQLKKAIPKMGVKKGKIDIAFVFVDNVTDEKISNIFNRLSLKRDDKVLEGNINTLKKYGIKEKEYRTVAEAKYGDLILEKVALVDIIK